MSISKARTTKPGGSRFYTLGGRQYWSVTTILSALNKPALVPWAAKSVAEFAVDNADSWLSLARSGQRQAAVDLLKRSPYITKSAAADLGSAVHAAAEAHALNKPVPPWPDDVAPFMGHFEQFIVDFEPTFEMSEAIVYSESQSYAGTLDMLVYIDGVLWLLDIKTGKGVYAETAMQLALYARAEKVWLSEAEQAPMPQVERAGVLHLRPDGYQLVPVDIGEPVFLSALYCREMYRWQEEISKGVLGEPLERRAS